MSVIQLMSCLGFIIGLRQPKPCGKQAENCFQVENYFQLSQIGAPQGPPGQGQPGGPEEAPWLTHIITVILYLKTVFQSSFTRVFGQLKHTDNNYPKNFLFFIVFFGSFRQNKFKIVSFRSWRQNISNFFNRIFFEFKATITRVVKGVQNSLFTMKLPKFKSS